MVGEVGGGRVDGGVVGGWMVGEVGGGRVDGRGGGRREGGW